MRAVNLIPAGQRPGASKITGDSDGAAFIVIGVIVGLAILMFLYGKANKEVSSRQSEAASLAARAQSAQEQANKLTPYTSFIGLQTERVNAVSQLIGTRFDWAHAFHELGRVLPTNVSLSSVQGTIGGGSSSSTPASASSSSSGSVSSATPPGSTPTMTLTGCTDSQSDVAVALARLRLINGVTEVSLQGSTKSGAEGGACGANSPAFTAQVTFAGLPSPAAPSTGSGSTTPAATSTPSSTTTTTTTQSTVSTPASPAPTTASTASSHASPTPTTASTASPHASLAPTTVSTHSTSANGNS